MRVGLVIYGGLEDQSGGYLYDRMLVDHLHREGDEIEVFSIRNKGNGANLLDNLDPRLLRRLERSGVDLLIEDELNYASLCLLNHRLRKTTDFPLVSIVHNLSCRTEIESAPCNRCELLERRFLSSLDGFIFNSAATKASVEALRTFAPGVIARPGKEHVRPVPHGYELRSPLQALYLGNIMPHKGLEVLVRAIKSLPPGSIELDVAGAAYDIEYYRRTRALVHTLGLDPYVHFHGQVGDDRRDELLERTNVLISPSYYEGYGLAFVEAMAFGVPVIAPSAGGAGEIITDGKEGFLVPPGDPAALFSILSQLVSDPSVLREMSHRAIQKFDSLPTWEEGVKAAREYLVRLCRQGRSGSGASS